MYNKNKKLVCITGMDGSGKSTLIENLRKHFTDSCEASVWDALENKNTALFSDKKKVDGYLCQLDTNSRLLFLAHAMHYSIQKALAGPTEYIFINAYFYKYFATEKVMGADANLISSLIDLFPSPQKTIHLELSVAKSADRKIYFSKYECGCAENTIGNFIAFQEKVHPEFAQFILPSWLLLDAGESKEILIEKSKSFIES